MNIPRLSAAAPIALALAFVASRAAAEPTAADKETARRLMAEGRDRREKNDLNGALQSFQAADAIMQVPTTGVEVARTEVALGQFVEARDKLLAVTRYPQAPHEPKPFVDARSAAQWLSDQIAPRIPSIKITLRGVPAGATAAVTVDGVNVPPASLVEPRAVDPGHHVIVAHVGNGEPAKVEVDVLESAVQEVALDVPAPPAVAEETPTPASPSDTPVVEKPRRRTLAYIGFGVGAAGIATGAITGLIAISKFNAAKSGGCVGNECPPSTYPDLNSAGSMATISTIGFIVGGVGAAVGVVGLVVGGHHPADSASSPQALVTPWIGPGAAGLRGTF